MSFGLPQTRPAPPQSRTFTRLQRLLDDELKPRDIELIVRVEPETLEITVDPDLLDQALINLVRNAMDARRDKPAGQITLLATQDAAGRPIITVADKMAPALPRTSARKSSCRSIPPRRHGSGVGLTLVRRIAAVHGASVSISESEGGGAAISMRF